MLPHINHAQLHNQGFPHDIFALVIQQYPTKNAKITRGNPKQIWSSPSDFHTFGYNDATRCSSNTGNSCQCNCLAWTNRSQSCLSVGNIRGNKNQNKNHPQEYPICITSYCDIKGRKSFRVTLINHRTITGDSCPSSGRK